LTKISRSKIRWWEPKISAMNSYGTAQPKIIVLQLLVLVLAVGCGGANNIFHRKDRY
jgi:hypothetical protein